MIKVTQPNFQSIFSDNQTSLWQSNETNIDLAEIKEESFLIYSKKQSIFKQKKLGINGSLIFKKKEYGLIKWCNVSNAIIEIIQNDDIQQSRNGIRLIKNDIVFEFYGYIDAWFKDLKKFCIQRNIKQKYNIGKQIGQGTFANVYQLEKIDDQSQYAVKIYKKKCESFDKECVSLELEILRKMDHHNVSSLIETFESNSYIFIVQELFSYGNLDEKIYNGKFTEEEIIKAIYKLLEAIVSINSKGIIHRDIKAENILFRKPQMEQLIISDFSLADYYNENETYKYSRVGTPGNVAPEILQDRKYGYKVDLYGIGIIFYQMITKGNTPFYSQDYNVTLIKNEEGFIDFNNIDTSPQIKNLLIKMLDPNPQTRISAQQAKSDIVFKKYNRQTIYIVRKKQNQEYQSTINTYSPRSSSNYQSPQHFQSPLFINSPKISIYRSPLQQKITTRDSDINTNIHSLQSLSRKSYQSKCKTPKIINNGQRRYQSTYLKNKNNL